MRILFALLAFAALALPTEARAQDANCITVHDQLFGPIPGTNNGHVFTPPTVFTPLSAFTAGTKDYWWHYPPPSIREVRFYVIWTPHPGAEVMLSHVTNGAATQAPICVATAPAVVTGPIQSQCDPTAAMQQYATQGVPFHLAAFYRGNGVDTVRLYETRLTFVYCFGA